MEYLPEKIFITRTYLAEKCKYTTVFLKKIYIYCVYIYIYIYIYIIIIIIIIIKSIN